MIVVGGVGEGVCSWVWVYAFYVRYVRETLYDFDNWVVVWLYLG